MHIRFKRKSYSYWDDKSRTVRQCYSHGDNVHTCRKSSTSYRHHLISIIIIIY